MKRRLFIALLAVAATSVVGWQLWMRFPTYMWNRQTETKFDSIPGSPTTHPAFWQLSRDRQEPLIAALNRIKLGDQKDGIIAVLGKPDEDHVLAPIGLFRPLKPHGTAIKYQFVRYEDGLVNEKWDQSVMLSFDMDGHLHEVDSTVPEIPTRGEMIRRPPD